MNGHNVHRSYYLARINREEWQDMTVKIEAGYVNMTRLEWKKYIKRKRSDQCQK